MSIRVLKGLKCSNPLALVPHGLVLNGKQGAEMLWFEFVGTTLDLKPEKPSPYTHTHTVGRYNYSA